MKKKFDIAEDYALVRDFEKETRISLDAEKQVQKEERKKVGFGNVKGYHCLK